MILLKIRKHFNQRDLLGKSLKKEKPTIKYSLRLFRPLKLNIKNRFTGCMKCSEPESMGARYRVGIGWSYRPARLHSLAELVPWNKFLGSLKRLKIRALLARPLPCFLSSQTGKKVSVSFFHYLVC
jgi:hypothetical protein